MTTHDESPFGPETLADAEEALLTALAMHDAAMKLTAVGQGQKGADIEGRGWRLIKTAGRIVERVRLALLDAKPDPVPEASAPEPPTVGYDVSQTIPAPNRVTVVRTTEDGMLVGQRAAALMCEGGPFNGKRLPFVDLAEQKWLYLLGSNFLVVSVAQDAAPTMPIGFAEQGRWLGLYSATDEDAPATWSVYAPLSSSNGIDQLPPPSFLN